jgi:hypothetical protein
MPVLDAFLQVMPADPPAAVEPDESSAAPLLQWQFRGRTALLEVLHHSI